MIRQPVVIALAHRRVGRDGIHRAAHGRRHAADALLAAAGPAAGGLGRQSSLRSVVIAISAWSLPLLFCVPVFSRDVYAYTGQGRLVMEGQNPYEVGISTLNNWFALGADPAWAENRTPYGPYFLWLARGVVGLTGAQPDVVGPALPAAGRRRRAAVRHLRAQARRTARHQRGARPLGLGGQPAVPHQLHRQRPQ